MVEWNHIMNKYVVTVQLMPTNFNRPTSYVVEANSSTDARAVLKDELRDLGKMEKYTYDVKDYVPPPAGRVVGRV